MAATPPSRSSLYGSKEEVSLIRPPPVPKKKRNLPGTPNPNSEVVALSPRTLMATNRFECEVCNKGFKREQNLQLHRRGHNLPWILKQKSTGKDSKRKVYLCPEPTCVHHDPSRALGDLTGIKKHYSRKHGDKKFKCEKCSKSYAVQSDWKAHSRTCGTREYRCDCGTLFSRRDSFITHRAFCDTLARETATHYPPFPNIRSHFYGPTDIPLCPQMHHPEQYHHSHSNYLIQHYPNQQHGLFQHQHEVIRRNPSSSPMGLFENNMIMGDQIESSEFSSLFGIPSFQDERAVPSANISGTALLQKAAKIGSTSSLLTKESECQLHDLMNSFGEYGSFEMEQNKVRFSCMGESMLQQDMGSDDRMTRDFLGVGQIVPSLGSHALKRENHKKGEGVHLG